jgi:DNA-binding transcriptional MerR regulator
MRLYSDADVERILYIRQLVHDGGYTLEAIARILDDSRLSLPQLMEDLGEAEHSGSQALREIAAELRGLVEDVHLKDITSREREREGGVLWGISSLVKRLVGADSFMKAGSTLVIGAQELTGAQSAGLGIYEAQGDTLTYVLSARAGQLQQPTNLAWPVEQMPDAWRRALREGRPYYARRFRVEELPPEVQPRVRASGIKSFYSHPLKVGSELVGTLVISSPKLDGIKPEMQAICQHLAAPAAAAIAYFAWRAPAAADSAGRPKT